MEYGLSEKETEIYLTVLKLGPSTSNLINQKTSIARSTVYDVATNLVNKGLMASFQKDKKTYFEAKPPEAFFEQIKQKKELVQRILPDLQKISNSVTQKSEITVYKGKTGLRTAAEEMLKSKEILVYGGGIKADEVFGHYNENFARKRVENKIVLKSIVGTKIPVHMIDKKIAKYTKIKRLDFLNDYQTTYFIFDDNFLIWDYGDDLTAIKIKSMSNTKSQRELFNFLWSVAKE